VSLSDDLSPPRRPLFFPVVIATVFLTIIGVSAGLALGSYHRSHVQVVSDNPPDLYEETPAPAPEQSGTACPPEMHDTAQRKFNITSRLVQVLRVSAADTGTTVWICRDGSDKLYYQANKGGEAERWVEGETALFLPGVTEQDGTYTVVAPDGNVFSVNEQQLKVKFKNGRPTEVHEVEPD
jgi:hypothetical protein